MMFFVGHHHPSKAKHINRAFISVNALWDRKSDLEANDWILDSGAFTTIALHGGYPKDRSVEAYAAQVNRWRTCGNLMKAVAQDYMCESWMLERTGMDIPRHQELTIYRYVGLRRLCGGIIMPCIQGQVPGDYVEHLRMYGQILEPGEWVGVGSVCKRKNDSAIREVLRAIKGERPDLRLHGFGLKLTALRCAEVWDTLYSADSMAWSYAERMKRRDGLKGDPNGLAPALEFEERINTMPRQEVLL